MSWAPVAGFLLGAAGSLHCVGMCGPLAMLAPVDRRSTLSSVGSIVAYQLGRTSLYTVLGAIAGTLGGSFTPAGWQPYVALASGLFTIAAGFYLFARRRQSAPVKNAAFTRRWQNLLLRLLKQPPTWYRAAAFGAINGLLPCGMVYFALVAAAGAPGWLSAAGFMAGFGAGTIPAMSLSAMGFQWLRLQSGRLYSRWFPLMMVCTGLLLVLRGFSEWPESLPKMAIHCLPQ